MVLARMLPLPFELRLEPRDRGRAVEKRLARALPDAHWSHLMKLLRRRQVRLEDGRVLRKGDPLPGEGRLLVVPPEQAGPAPPPAPNRRIAFRVLHEDPDLAVVVKPAPLPMHPGPGHGTDTFLNALVGRWPELAARGAARGWGLVHRLDRETSGLLVVARTARARDALVQAFAARAVEKRYRALVQGRPQPAAGEVRAPVGGKEAHTAWETEEVAGEVALLRLWPRTGRTHQLRVHLAGLGCPVVGDDRYGPPDPGEQVRRLHLPRLALHAEALAFVHPVSGARLAFEDPWPRELRRAWSRARKLARPAGGAS